MEKRLMNVRELSEYASIPVASLYTYVSIGKIPASCVCRIGRALKFEKAAIDQWISGLNAPQANAQG